MIVLDTTMLVYAVGGDHPRSAPCRDVVAAIGAGSVAATTTVGVPAADGFTEALPTV